MATKKDEFDSGAADVKEKVDAEQAQGFVGTRVDPTPLEHYTVSGVTAGKPTPETDADALAEAQRSTSRQI